MLLVQTRVPEEKRQYMVGCALGKCYILNAITFEGNPPSEKATFLI